MANDNHLFFEIGQQKINFSFFVIFENFITNGVLHCLWIIQFIPILNSRQTCKLKNFSNPQE